MAYVSKEEFLAMQAAQAARTQTQTNYSDRPRVGFLGLNDGETAIVRFAYSTPDDVYSDVVTCHNTTINGKFRKVSCLRKPSEPIEMCPMCSAGDRYSNRIYVRLIEYTRDANGAIVATPKVFDRPKAFKDVLDSLFTEYGDISDQIFKIQRIGAKGSQSQYPVMLCNPAIYNAQLYPKDFSAFDNYNIIGGPVASKTFDEMAELAKSVVPAENPYRNAQPAAQDTVTQPAQAFGVAQQAAPAEQSYYRQPVQPQGNFADTQTPRRVPIYQ